MIRDIVQFLSWVAIHKEARLCYSTDDCDCRWVDYTAEELEALLVEYKARKEAIAQKVADEAGS